MIRFRFYFRRRLDKMNYIPVICFSNADFALPSMQGSLLDYSFQFAPNAVPSQAHPNQNTRHFVQKKQNLYLFATVHTEVLQ